MTGAPLPGARAERGFTLIEIMVVVLVIGILYGLAVFAVGDREAEAVRDTARRLHATLRLAAEETVIRARPIGLAVDESGYRFLLADADGEWRAIDNDRALGPRSVPPVVQLRLHTEGIPETVAERGERDAGPRTALLPTGEVVPFRLVVRGERERPDWLIEGTADGRITLTRRD